MRKKIMVAAILLLAGLSACNKEDFGPKYPDRQQHIIGKWMHVSEGWIDSEGMEQFREDTSGRYKEYRPDWKLIKYFGSGEPNDDNVYRIDREFVYEYAADKNVDGDYIYKYTFTGEDELRLDYKKGFMNRLYPSITIHIYKRIK
jgi:hypothetical protein